MANVKTDTADRELVISRVINAPRELVYKLWTDPEHVGEWWGPNGFRNTIYEMDVRPGGVWRYMMHAADGTDFPNKIIYKHIVPGQRLEYLHGDGSEDESTYFDVTVTFEEEGDKTNVTMRMVFTSAEEKRMVVERAGAVEGGNQTMNRLGYYVSYFDNDSVFTLIREFDASAELLYQMHSQEEHMAHWWGPVGTKSVVKEFSFQPGGVMHHKMEDPGGGGGMYGKLYYKDIVPNKRIVLINTFSDEAGNITKHPMAPDWPAEMLTTISFEQVGDTGRLTVQIVPYNATKSEQDAFISGFDSMRGGFGSSFDALNNYIKSLS